MTTRYRRVQQSDGAERNEEELNKKKRAERVEKITAKLHAVVWVIVAILAFVFSDIIRIAIYDHRVNR